MKKLLLILCVAASSNFIMAQGQNLPYISTPTIIPQSPTSSDVIKIITKVTTPNQGILIDPVTFSVTQNPNEIRIRGCYSNGMLTALKDYIDTFTVGQLTNGNYVIKHKAYLSTAQQHCNPTDSNMVVTAFMVGGLTTGLIENHSMFPGYVFPNPAKDFLYLKNTSGYLDAQIYSSNGSLIRNETLSLNSEINIKELPAGLYFIRFRNEDKSEIHKFVKAD